MVKGELDYYMKRHNVVDEGFDMVARYAEEGDSTLSSYMPCSRITPMGFYKYKGVKRQGKGIIRDSLGRIIIGLWHADTLASGIRIDSTGIYAGQFNRLLQAEGHGTYRATDGSFYEGHWHGDMREGFGFHVSSSNLRAGIWKRDRYLGERMHYTGDRIYGIDISRYQHEQRRRVFPITWKLLRITNLGKKTERPVIDKVDYPVSFVYIKATEGISIRNRYFLSDYNDARRHKIPVGAYHFFRTQMKGRLQANYFLSQTRLNRGDLPPVLDIEPTDKQIAKAGGPEAMFREIREWLSIVEKRAGTRPILYVNQRFVWKYLDGAPDLKQNYLIWIARYGVYKPDVHLALWQLSADGRVTGIHPEVDINVFNGYAGQWEEFLREETVK
jgi:lysozyme